MAELKIPESVQIGLERLVALSDEQVDELVNALESEHPTIVQPNLTTRIAKRVKTIDPEDTDQLVSTILGLHAGILSLDAEIPTFIERVYSSIELDEKQRDSLKNRLTRLLGLEQVGLTAKAADVLLEHEHTFHSARIMTDIRPIFVNDPSKSEMSAAVIVHMFKLTYHEGDDDKEIFLALDSTDIDNLRKKLDRAEKKEKSLKTTLEALNIRCLGFE